MKNENLNNLAWINASKKTKLTYILMFAFFVALSNYFILSIEFEIVKWIAFTINNTLYIWAFDNAYQRIKALKQNK